LVRLAFERYGPRVRYNIRYTKANLAQDILRVGIIFEEFI